MLTFVYCYRFFFLARRSLQAARALRAEKLRIEAERERKIEERWEKRDRRIKEFLARKGVGNESTAASFRDHNFYFSVESFDYFLFCCSQLMMPVVFFCSIFVM